MLVVDKVRNDTICLDDAPKDETEILVTSTKTSQKLKGDEKNIEINKGKGREVEPVLKTIPLPPPHFLQILKKN